jgi:hypothetical protein
MKRYNETERTEIIKRMASDCADDSILKTPLADFIPVGEGESDSVSQLAQNMLNVCNRNTNVSHDIVVASLALALFSACSSAFNMIPSPSKLIH